MKHLLLLFLFLIFLSCRNSTANDPDRPVLAALSENLEGYADGQYCAEVQYYYPKTGTRSTYTLSVEIEENELIVIHWPNGGWLDESHFDPPDISTGEAEFVSDRGYEYTVEIIGVDGECD